MALVGIISKKATLHVPHTFLEHFFAVVLHDYNFQKLLRACLHGGGRPQTGEVTCGRSPQLSCKRDQIEMRDYMDRRVTSPNWGAPPPCKQALSYPFLGGNVVHVLVHLFFTATHFHLALMAASIFHVVTAVRKFSCCSSNKK